MRVGTLAATSFAVVVAIAPGLSYAQASKPAASAKTQAPDAAYLEFVKVAVKAPSVASIEKYLAASLLEDLKKFPDQQPNWLKFQKINWTLTDRVLGKPAISGDKATFEVTGRTTDGRQAKGTVTMAREGGRWKVEDEVFAIQ